MPLSTVDEEKTGFEPLPKEVYEARLIDIEEREGAYGKYWSWKYEISEDPFKGRFQWSSTNNNVHPQAKGNSPRQPAEALVGRTIGDDEFRSGADFMELIGLPCRLSVGVGKNKKGEPCNVVDSVLPAKKGQAPAKRTGGKPSPQEVLNEAKRQQTLEAEFEDDGEEAITELETLGFARRRLEAVEGIKKLLGWDVAKIKGWLVDQGVPDTAFANLTVRNQKKAVLLLEDMAKDVEF